MVDAEAPIIIEEVVNACVYVDKAPYSPLELEEIADCSSYVSVPRDQSPYEQQS